MNLFKRVPTNGRNDGDADHITDRLVGLPANWLTGLVWGASLRPSRCLYNTHRGNPILRAARRKGRGGGGCRPVCDDVGAGARRRATGGAVAGPSPREGGSGPVRLGAGRSVSRTPAAPDALHGSSALALVRKTRYFSTPPSAVRVPGSAACRLVR